MAFQVIWSPAANIDLADLATYIAEYDAIVAGAFVRNIFRAVERLPIFPSSGRTVPEFSDPAIREVIKRPCRIVYRVKETEQIVEIARVWHAARGIPKL